MQLCTPTVLSFTLLWDKSRRAPALQDPTLCNQDIMSRKKDWKTKRLKTFTSPRVSDPVSSIKVRECSITPSNEVKDLGVKIDRHLTFKTHINNICRSASRSIHHIEKIRNFLSRSASERPIHAFVSSKRDYCNSILHGLPSYLLEKLQRLQR